MELIETITLSSSATSITFSSIPSDATDLLLVVSIRDDKGTATTSGAGLRFNSDTAGNYSSRRLQGTGSSVGSFTQSGSTSIVFPVNGGGTTSNTFHNAMAYIPNYTSSSAKSVSIDMVTENNATDAQQHITAGLWNQTSAITSVTVFNDNAANFVSGSTASLYKITKA